MSTLVGSTLVVLVAFLFGTASADETLTTNNRQERQSDLERSVYGVASIAGVTSRNGRVPTTGGIHFYPAPDGTIATSGDGYYNPMTFTKAINGKYASGSVQIQPGALAVSSSVRSGYTDPGFNHWPVQSYQWPVQDNKWPILDQWPLQNQFYTPYGHRNGAWYNNLKFDPQATGVRRWLYPSFNPFFNLWQL